MSCNLFPSQTFFLYFCGVQLQSSLTRTAMFLTVTLPLYDLHNVLEFIPHNFHIIITHPRRHRMQQTLIDMTSDLVAGTGSQNLTYVWERNHVLKLACGSDIPFPLQCKSHKVSLCLKKYTASRWVDRARRKDNLFRHVYMPRIRSQRTFAKLD